MMTDKQNKQTEEQRLLDSQEADAQAAVQDHRPRLDERFLINIQGKDFVLYTGLLDLAHQHGLLKLEVEQIQVPLKENDYTAICRATAIAQNGAVFSDVGDANPGNVNRKIAPHVLRMASTRAKARVLRDLTNIGITCLEELGDLDDALTEDYSEKRSQNRFSSHANHNSSGHQPNQHSPVKNARSKFIESGEKTADPAQKSNAKVKVQENKPEIQPEATEDQPPLPRMSMPQRRAVYNLAGRQGLSEEELKQLVFKKFGTPMNEISTVDAAALIQYLQKAS